MTSIVSTGDAGGGETCDIAGDFAASGDRREDRSRSEAFGPCSSPSETTGISLSTTADTTGLEPTLAKSGAAFPPPPLGKEEARPNGRFGALQCETTAGRAAESSIDSFPLLGFAKPRSMHSASSVHDITRPSRTSRKSGPSPPPAGVAGSCGAMSIGLVVIAGTGVMSMAPPKSTTDIIAIPAQRL